MEVLAYMCYFILIYLGIKGYDVIVQAAKPKTYD